MPETQDMTSRTEDTECDGPQLAIHYASTTYFHQGTNLLKVGRYADAEFYLRESLRMRPDDAETLNNLGTAVWQQGRIPEADSYYRRADQLKPNDFAIVNNLGNSLWEQHRLDEAAGCYRRAITLKSDSHETWMNLGVLLTDLEQFDEAIACIKESLRLKPDSHEAIGNLGATLARQGKWQEALACYDQSIRLQHYYAEAHRCRAFAWLADGDFERGWAEYEWRLRCRKHVGSSPNCPRWNGEDLEGRTILLHAEQGLGDTIQFLRYASLVKNRGGKVLILCPAPLIRLIARHADVADAFDGSTPLPHFDLHSPLLSLPWVFGTTLATVPADVPYLSVDASTVTTWKAAVQGALGSEDGRNCLKIGIAWQGNPRNRTDRSRSFPLSALAPLSAVPGVRLLSLQKEDGLNQLRALDGQFPVAELTNPVVGLEDNRDLLDTAAIISQLDLLVTPDSALAHLAGSLGARVWVALPFTAEWRWLKDREDSPWYPTMRLFRQKKRHDWTGVFLRMAETLRNGLPA